VPDMFCSLSTLLYVLYLMVFLHVSNGISIARLEPLNGFVTEG